MDSAWLRRHRFLYAICAIAVLVFAILSLALYRLVDAAVQSDVLGQTSAAAANTAVAVANAIREDVRLATAVAGADGSAALAGGTASRAATYAVEFANINIQRANPQVTAFYYFNQTGTFVVGQTVNPTHQPVHQLSVSCDATNTYCIDGNPPATGYLSAPGTRLVLVGLLHTPVTTRVVLAFGRHAGPYGDIFVMQPIPAPDGRAFTGILVERVDGASIFSPYVTGGTNSNLILAGNVLIGPSIIALHQAGLLPVTTVDPGLDPALSGGLRQTAAGAIPPGPQPRFTIAGEAVVASLQGVGVANLVVVSYASAHALADASTRLILAALPFVVLLLICVLGPFLYQGRRTRLRERATTAELRAQSESLARDILSVTQALEAARLDSLSVPTSAKRSAVDQLSRSLVTLLARYSQVAGRVDSAALRARDAAAAVDQDFQRILSLASAQSASVNALSARMRELESSAPRLRQYGEDAMRAVTMAQAMVDGSHESIERVEDAGEAIKTAAVEFSQEFGRLQQYAPRLTTVVTSVRAIAEGLQSQASYDDAHPSGALAPATATNIARLARDAQGAVVDAEGVMRAVGSSITELSSRLERLWDRVRLNANEVRGAERSFEAVEQTQRALRAALETLAASAEQQTLAARQAAPSLATIEPGVATLVDLIAGERAALAGMLSTIAALRALAADLAMPEPQRQ